MNLYTRKRLCWLTSKNFFTSVLCRHGFSLKKLAGTTDNKDGWRERERERERESQGNPCYQYNLIMRMMMMIIFIIKCFRTIIFIFIVISTTFRPICPQAFFRCLLNSGINTELRTTSFIEFTGVACSDSVRHNRVQVLSIPVLLLARSQD